MENHTNTLFFKKPVSILSTQTDSLLLYGGVTVHNTTDATGINSGGSFTTYGGFSIQKKLFVGGQTQLTDSTESTDTSSGAFIVSGGVGIVKNANIGGKLTIHSQDPSDKSSSGALVLAGGLGIHQTSSATSLTSGGALTIAGGAAIEKNMFVGSNLVVTTKDITPSLGDISKERAYIGGSNQTNQAVTGLSFDSELVRSFNAIVSSQVIYSNSVNNQYANYELKGLQKNGSWVINSSYIGDNIGLVFSINNSGQVFYSSPDFGPDFTELKFGFRATTTSIYDVGNDASVIASYTGGTIVMTGDNSPWFELDGSEVYYEGNVGIGTNNPTYRLHVAGGNALLEQYVTAGHLNVTEDLTTNTLVAQSADMNSATTGNAFINGLVSLSGTIGHLKVTGDLEANLNLENIQTISATIGTLSVTGDSTFDGHLLPSETETFDLGSPTKRWRSAYIASNTIYIGDTPISAATEGTISFGETILATSTSSNVETSLGGGVVRVTNTTESINSSTGALIVSGGASILGNVNIGNNLDIKNELSSNKINVTTATIGELNLTGTSTISNVNATSLTAASAKLSDAVITNANVTTLTAGSARLSDAVITTANVTNGNVTSLTAGSASVGDAVITNGNVTALTAGSVSVSDAVLTNANITSLTAGSVSVSDAVLTNANITSLTAGSARLSDAFITSANVTNGNVTALTAGSARLSDVVITTANVTNGNITSLTAGSARLSDAVITTANVTNGNVTALTAGSASVGDAVIITANATSLTAGSARLSDAVITTANVTNGNVTSLTAGSASVSDAVIITANATSLTAGSARLSDAVITTANVTNGNVTSLTAGSARLSDAVITTANVTNGNVTSLTAGSARLSDAVITTVNVTNGNVTALTAGSARLSDAIITTANVTNGNVTALTAGSAKITDAVITTANVTNGNVTALTAGSAKITDAVVSTANVTTLTAGSASVSDVVMTTANVTTLTAGSAKLSEVVMTNGNVTTLTAGSARLSDAVMTNSNITTLTSSSLLVTGPSVFANGTFGHLEITDVLSSGDLVVDRITTGSVHVRGESHFTGTLNAQTTSTGNLHVTGDTVITGNLTVYGTSGQVSLQSTVLDIGDNKIKLNSGPYGLADAGFLITRGTTANYATMFYNTPENEFLFGYTNSEDTTANIVLSPDTLGGTVYANLAAHSLNLRGDLNATAGTATLANANITTATIGSAKISTLTLENETVGSSTIGSLRVIDQASATSMSVSNNATVGSLHISSGGGNGVRIYDGSILASAVSLSGSLDVASTINGGSSLTVSGAASSSSMKVSGNATIGSLLVTGGNGVRINGGDLTAGSAILAGALSVSSGITASGISLSGNASANSLNVSAASSTGSMFIGNGSSAYSLDLNGWMKFGDSNGKAYLVAGNGWIGFRDNNQVDRFSISQSTGNVGIGITNPVYPLQINAPYYGVNYRAFGGSAATFYGTASSSGSMFDHTATLVLATNNVYNRGWGSSIGFAGPNVAGENMLYGKITGLKQEDGDGYNGVIAFNVVEGGFGRLEERMRINASGNVGIGTTNPAYRLDVVGEQRISTSTSNPILTLNSTSTSSLTLLDMYAPNISGGNGSYMRFGANNGSGNHMQVLYQHFANADSRNNCSLSVGSASITLANNGNVGIGTVLPNSLNLLHIYGSVNGEVGSRITNANNGSSAYSILRIDNDTADDLVVFLNSSTRTNDGGVNSATIRNDAGDLNLQSKGASGIRISSTTGNVGIGLTNPSYKLDVTGESRINGALVLNGGTTTYSGSTTIDQGNRTNTYITFTDNGATSDHAYLRQLGGVNGFMLSLDFHDDGDDAGFQIRDVQSSANPDSAPITRFMVNRGGNVGIGTITPYSNLQINSSLAPTNSLVNTSSHALTLAYEGNPDSYNIGPSLVFAQRWFGGSSACTGTGAIRGFKQNPSGAFGGGLQFLYGPNGLDTFAIGMTLNMSGNVGITTNDPQKEIHIYAKGTGTNDTTERVALRIQGRYSGMTNGFWDISTNGFPLQFRYDNTLKTSLNQESGAVQVSSDSRIKTNIEDINDSSALNLLRQIKPKTYNYIEPGRTTNKVYGFIADEIEELIPHAVTKTTNYIPSILAEASIQKLEDENDENRHIYQLQLTNKQLPQAIGLGSRLLIRIDSGENKPISVLEVINDTTVKVESNDELENGNVQVYGHYIDDFRTLDKSYIFTVSVAALQEVDRQLQSEKEAHLETKQELLTLKERLDALEARLA